MKFWSRNNFDQLDQLIPQNVYYLDASLFDKKLRKKLHTVCQQRNFYHFGALGSSSKVEFFYDFGWLTWLILSKWLLFLANLCCKDLFIKIRTTTVVKLLLILYEFLWLVFMYVIRWFAEFWITNICYCLFSDPLRERSLMTSHIRVGRGVQDSPQKWGMSLMNVH